MMNNIYLPPLKIAPLERISPSGFAALSQCRLRAACQAAKQFALLPQSPSSALGTIAHKLIERAGKGEVAGTADDFARRWDEMVAAREAKFQDIVLQRRFVPLRQHISHFEVLRWQVCCRAASIAAQVTVSKGSPTEENIRVYHEELVATADGTIVGVIDFVREAPEGVLLRDYKSGSIWDKGATPSGPNLLKEEYQTQLKLYAALWWERTEQWPARLELAPLDGAPVEVPFMADECIQILGKARSSLEHTNACIWSVLQTSPSNVEPLASPDPQVCRFCLFRPGCAAYWKRRECVAVEESSQWPGDERGTIVKKQVLGNGRVMLRLLNSNGREIFVRLKSDQYWYPKLEELQENDRVSVYNLKQSNAGSMFEETAFTAIYS